MKEESQVIDLPLSSAEVTTVTMVSASQTDCPGPGVGQVGPPVNWHLVVVWAQGDSV